MTAAVRSFAKINIGLYIGKLRADGFHELRTVYQRIALHDLVHEAGSLSVLRSDCLCGVALAELRAMRLLHCWLSSGYSGSNCTGLRNYKLPRRSGLIFRFS